MDVIGTGTRRRMRWLAVIAVCILASVMTSARGGIMIGKDGSITRIAIAQLFVQSLIAYGWWALLSPAIATVVRRIAAAHVHAAARAAMHMASAAAFVLADFLLLALVPTRSPLGVSLHWNGLRSILPEAMAIYSLIAIAAIAFAAQERAMQREYESTQLAAQVAAMRMHLLRAQLHPHFLFNSLHAISTLIDWRPADARRMLVGLSELLRETVHFIDETEVPLGRELDWLEQYVELQQLRYEERLVVDFDIAPATVAALVPPLLLQPLVENAIKHGIEPRAEGGRINVSAARDGAHLQLRVYDNGRGIDAPATSRGVGIRNTRERLATLYGGDYSFVLRDAAGGGVEAMISIPFRTNAQAVVA
jgi:two-component system LytT family sensor kinase